MMRDHQYVGYPICRQIKASYFERTGTLFTSLQEVERYVEEPFPVAHIGFLEKLWQHLP